MCSKYHSLMLYYQATMFAIFCCHCYDGMVVMGDMCVQSIKAIRTTIRLLCW